VWHRLSACERTWLLHAFIAKEVYQFATHEALYDALRARPTLRRLCGWENVDQVPSLSTFCRPLHNSPPMSCPKDS